MALIEVIGVVPDGSSPGPGVPFDPRQQISMTQGGSLTVRMRLFNPRGAPIDVVNVSSTHVLSVKKNPDDNVALVSRPGAPQPQLGINVVDFVLSPNDTRLVEPGNKGYDVFSTINGVRDPTIPMSPWKILPAVGQLNAPVSSVTLVPLTIFGLPLNGTLGQSLVVTGLNPFTVGWGTAGLPAFFGANGAVIQETGHPGPPSYVTAPLTQDQILAAFTVGLSAGFTTIKELGDTIANPSFTPSSNRPAVAATLDDSDNPGPIALTTLPFAGAVAYGTPPLPARSYVHAALNALVTWTLSANEGGPNKSASASAQWQARAYFGHRAPGAFNQAFILSLSGSRLQAGFGAGSYAFSAPGPGEKLYVVLPTGLAAPSSWRDQNNDAFPMTPVASGVAVTNGFSAVVPGGYTVWESDNFITSAFTLTGVP